MSSWCWCRLMEDSPPAGLGDVLHQQIFLPSSRCSCNLSGDLQSSSACPPYIISHFILFSFSKTAPPLSPSLISPLPRRFAGPLPPFPLLHLHLGSTRLPKCFLGVRWLIGSHLLGESGLYGILGNLCQEFYHIDLVLSLHPEFTDFYLFVILYVSSRIKIFWHLLGFSVQDEACTKCMSFYSATLPVVKEFSEARRGTEMKCSNLISWCGNALFCNSNISASTSPCCCFWSQTNQTDNAHFLPL